MTKIHAITFAVIFLSTTAGTTLAQGMLDVLRQQQEQFEKCRSICAEGITVATTNGDLLVIKNLEELNNSLPS